jgi:hypothetical protein
MEVKIDKDKKENHPVFLDGETVSGKVNKMTEINQNAKKIDLSAHVG